MDSASNVLAIDETKASQTISKLLEYGDGRLETEIENI